MADRAWRYWEHITPGVGTYFETLDNNDELWIGKYNPQCPYNGYGIIGAHYTIAPVKWRPITEHAFETYLNEVEASLEEDGENA